VSRSIGLPLLARSLFTILFSPATLRLGSAAGALAALAAGCETNRTVAVRVSIPDADSRETPAAGVGIIALPYDRDSVLSSLEARARSPRPPTAALDTMFARFRAPFTRYTGISLRATTLRDSLDLLRRRLDSIAPGSPDRRQLSARIRRMTDSALALDRQVERARVTLDRARAEFLIRSESLRPALRRWEDSTYRGYDSIVENLSRNRGREAVTDTTGDTGWAQVTLTPGQWWLYARAWDTSDPNAEWYWNVPAEDDTVLLSSRTGQRRPRY
jgi:hypothetical protein